MCSPCMRMSYTHWGRLAEGCGGISYKNTDCTTGVKRIATVLLLKDMENTYQVVNVEAVPGRDSCLPEKSVDGT